MGDHPDNSVETIEFASAWSPTMITHQQSCGKHARNRVETEDTAMLGGRSSTSSYWEVNNNAAATVTPSRAFSEDSWERDRTCSDYDVAERSLPRPFSLLDHFAAPSHSGSSIYLSPTTAAPPPVTTNHESLQQEQQVPLSVWQQGEYPTTPLANDSPSSPPHFIHQAAEMEDGQATSSCVLHHYDRDENNKPVGSEKDNSNFCDYYHYHQQEQQQSPQSSSLYGGRIGRICFETTVVTTLNSSEEGPESPFSTISHEDDDDQVAVDAYHYCSPKKKRRGHRRNRIQIVSYPASPSSIS